MKIVIISALISQTAASESEEQRRKLAENLSDLKVSESVSESEKKKERNTKRESE
jgi:hypothetical protein